MVKYIIMVIVGYLIGSIQPAYLLGKIVYKKNIKTLGTKNAGASNASLVFGLKFGVLVGILDIIKGIIVVVITHYFFKETVDLKTLQLIKYLSGSAAVLGHDFPFYMKFNGGKGTATILGIFIGISPLYGVIGGLMIVIVGLISNYIAIGTFALLVTFITYTAVFSMSVINILLACLLASISVFKHYENIIHIKQKKESKLRNIFKQKK